MHRIKYLLLFVILMQFVFLSLPTAYAATSPTLAALDSFSVLAGDTVTCTGPTTITGAVGVSPGTSITGFPSPCTASGGTHSNDASAIAAQAENLSVYTSIDQACDFTYGAQDLTLLSPLGPGVYCSTSSFTLSGNLTLTGSGVWIFKSVTTLITSPGSSVTGGDACNVWWRVGSAATLDTTTSFLGNILALSGIQLNAGASLDGRALVQSGGAATLDSNTISGPSCASAEAGGADSLTAFTEDQRCVATTPAGPQWALVSAATGGVNLTWSAEGGSRVDIEITNDQGEFVYRYSRVPNTGHMFLPNVSSSQQVRIRVFNECTSGDWLIASVSPTLPNTGLKPSSLYISLAVLVGMFGLLVLIKTKPKFLFRR